MYSYNTFLSHLESKDQSTRMASVRKEEPSVPKEKEELSVPKGKEELSVQERRAEIIKRAQENLVRWRGMTRQQILAELSGNVNQQQEEGKPKMRKSPEKRDRRRRFTCQERGDYNRRLKESGGFDVGDIPDDIDIRETPIMPYEVLVGSQNPSEVARLNKVENYSKLALDKYNKDNKTKFQFGKFLKATVGGRCGRGRWSYYVTFQSKYMPGSRPKNFQAHVIGGHYIDEGEVEHCRRVT